MLGDMLILCSASYNLLTKKILYNKEMSGLTPFSEIPVDEVEFVSKDSLVYW